MLLFDYFLLLHDSLRDKGSSKPRQGYCVTLAHIKYILVLRNDLFGTATRVAQSS